MKKTNMIDLHCDTFLKMMLPAEDGTRIHLKKNNLHIDIERLKKVGASAQMFAVFTPIKRLENYGFSAENSFEYVKAVSKLMDDEFKLNKDDIALATNYSDYLKNMNDGKISAFKTIEEGYILDNKIERMQELYDMNFRILGLIWCPENCNGFCNSKDPDLMSKGLKPFGIEVVEKANELGMIIDVSHLSDGGFYDVCKYSKKPFMATHSNCRLQAEKSTFC